MSTSRSRSRKRGRGRAQSRRRDRPTVSPATAASTTPAHGSHVQDHGPRDRQSASEARPGSLGTRQALTPDSSAPILPDTVTGAGEIGIGLTLAFTALTASNPPTAAIVVALGLATTVGMCHNYRTRREMTRSATRTAVVLGAGLAGVVAVVATLSMDLPVGTAPLISPVVLAVVAFGTRWLAERSPALTPWHLICWLLMVAGCLTSLLVPPSGALLVCGVVSGAALLVMGVVDNRRLSRAIGATPKGPKPPPNPVWEWVRV
ncbi:hypothetical protein [Acidipropionibacterium jensenii]|uniref:hypothetical protein n=1 Tax=Acidipropionibacterium jensenii TaxID=1749 RepID=UPI002649A36B|nr:hypothetical protein [Acidipropionibacterium jensenii]MDN6426193.1 hypothetical protein [Acidipropionibacterium jensenii]